MLLLLILIPSLAGLLLVSIGIRGSRTDQLPRCVDCGYLLGGQAWYDDESGVLTSTDPSAPWPTCPECGKRFRRGFTHVRIGQRRRGFQSIGWGAALLCTGIASLVPAYQQSGGTFSWIRAKPQGWLLSDAQREWRTWTRGGAEAGVPQVNALELYRRGTAGELRDGIIARAAVDASVCMRSIRAVDEIFAVAGGDPGILHRDLEDRGVADLGAIGLIDIAALGLSADVLTLEQRTDLLNSSIAVSLLAPDIAYRGERFIVGLAFTFHVPRDWPAVEWPMAIDRHPVSVRADEYWIDRNRLAPDMRFVVNGERPLYTMGDPPMLRAHSNYPRIDLSPGVYTLEVEYETAAQSYYYTNDFRYEASYGPYRDRQQFGLRSGDVAWRLEKPIRVAERTVPQERIPAPDGLKIEAFLRPNGGMGDEHYVVLRTHIPDRIGKLTARVELHGSAGKIDLGYLVHAGIKDRVSSEFRLSRRLREETVEFLQRCDPASLAVVLTSDAEVEPFGIDSRPVIDLQEQRVPVRFYPQYIDGTLRWFFRKESEDPHDLSTLPAARRWTRD
ncbi:MAG: hypothetical protein AAGJ54_06010 [Planctomycetota bacterium]